MLHNKSQRNKDKYIIGKYNQRSRLGCKLMKTLKLGQESIYQRNLLHLFFSLKITVLRVIREQIEN